MGTPQQMKTEEMKQAVLEIMVENSEEWLDKIKALPQIREAALFGINIHAVADDAKEAQEAVKAMFEKAGVRDYSVNRIIPSLEDVFVSSIETYDKEHKQT
jgi:ABC-2 type transport system ATP-binding protein